MTLRFWIFTALGLGCGADPPAAPAPTDAPAAELGTDLPGPTDAFKTPEVSTMLDAPDGSDASDGAIISELPEVMDVPEGGVLGDGHSEAGEALEDLGAPSCSRDGECVGFGERGVCDQLAGRCVECLSARDLCPADQHCDDATHTCTDGCRSDEGCVGAMRLRCDPSLHSCVACTRDDHCPAGRLCVAGACVVGCSASRPCASGTRCCAGGCADTQTSLLHCGRCESPCALANAEARCGSGSCAIARCAEAYADCDGEASNGCEVDLRGSVARCGSCSTVCRAPPGAVPICVDGSCSVRCEEFYDDCDMLPGNGCEARITSSAQHCGGCGRRCAVPNAAAACAEGVCALGRCDPGFADCDAEILNGCEANTALDVNHCGGCGRRCATPPRADPVCTAGVCGISACALGYGDCDRDATNGCEQSITGELNHCGACGLRCPTPPNATAECVSSRCGLGVCTGTYSDCDGSVANGCEANLASSTASCGSCGNTCPPGQSCVSGACACPAGTSYCAGACRDLATEVLHCGLCARGCASSQVCSAGSCVSPPLRFVLRWSSTGDLDLRVRTPAGSDIWSGNLTADGGRLDQNVRSAPGVETVFWAAIPSRGLYNLCVSSIGAVRFVSFTVEVYRGVTLAARYSGSRAGTTSQPACTTSAATYVSRFSY